MHPLVLARHLDRTRFDFRLCVIENTRSALRLEIERLGCPIDDLNLSRRFYNPLNMMRVLYGFYRVFRAQRPHIVQTQALHANLLARPAAKLAGIPVIISTENSLPDIERNPLRRLANTPLHGLNALWDRYTQRIVVISQALRQRKARTRPMQQKIEVIPPPFQVESVFPGLTAPRPLHDRQAPVIGVVGRLSREKGHRYLLAAMPGILAIAPQTRLLIVGAGPLEDELRQQVRALALTHCVEFRGYQRDVYAELARLDMLFVPSLSEAFGIVILEGLAVGLPVVGTRVGGIPEIITHRHTGILVPPGDAAALVQAFHHLFSSPEEAVQMGQRGREKVFADFHPTQFVARHEQLYTRAVAAACPAVFL